jgi:hypothetical protein
MILEWRVILLHAIKLAIKITKYLQLKNLETFFHQTVKPRSFKHMEASLSLHLQRTKRLREVLNQCDSYVTEKPHLCYKRANFYKNKFFLKKAHQIALSVRRVINLVVVQKNQLATIVKRLHVFTTIFFTLYIC